MHRPRVAPPSAAGGTRQPLTSSTGKAQKRRAGADSASDSQYSKTVSKRQKTATDSDEEHAEAHSSDHSSHVEMTRHIARASEPKHLLNGPITVLDSSDDDFAPGQNVAVVIPLSQWKRANHAPSRQISPSVKPAWQHVAKSAQSDQSDQSDCDDTSSLGGSVTKPLRRLQVSSVSNMEPATALMQHASQSQEPSQDDAMDIDIEGNSSDLDDSDLTSSRNPALPAKFLTSRAVPVTNKSKQKTASSFSARRPDPTRPSSGNTAKSGAIDSGDDDNFVAARPPVAARKRQTASRTTFAIANKSKHVTAQLATSSASEDDTDSDFIFACNQYTNAAPSLASRAVSVIDGATVAVANGGSDAESLSETLTTLSRTLSPMDGEDQDDRSDAHMLQKQDEDEDGETLRMGVGDELLDDGITQTFADLLPILFESAAEYEESGRTIAPELFDPVQEDVTFRLVEETHAPNAKGSKVMRRLEGWAAHVLGKYDTVVSMENYIQGDVICLSGFVRPMFADDSGDVDEDQDEVSVAGVIYLSTEQVVDCDAQYQDGQVSLWVATLSAWYLLGAPRPNSVGENSTWLLLHNLTAHLAHIVTTESAANVTLSEQSSYGAALKSFKVPDNLAPHIDPELVPIIFDCNLGAIVANLVDFHDPFTFDFDHRIATELQLSKPTKSKEKVDPVPKINKGKAKKPDAPTVGPSVLTPRVDAIRRELNVFEEGVARYGSGEFFVYPSARAPRNGAAHAADEDATEPNTNEIAVGDVVRSKHGTMYVVQEIDGTRAHLVKVVEGKETFVGAFAEAGVYFAVPSCCRRSLKDMAKTAIQVEMFFTGKSYVRLELDAHCPSCGPDRNAIEPEGVVALDEPPTGVDHPLLRVDDWDLLWPAIDTDGGSKVLVEQEWVYEGDFIYFSLAPKVDPGAPSISKKRPKEMALYAIGQVDALVEVPPPGHLGHLAESDDEVDEDNKDSEPHAKTLRYPKYVHAQVSLLGRWDSLWHPTRESGRHPRRLFYTDTAITIPATDILGTLCVVPLQHARDDFFAFPKNFVLVGAHSHHDPRKFLSVHHHVPAKWTADNDANNLEVFDDPKTLINGSATNIRIINLQLKALLFERGYAVHVPAASTTTPVADGAVDPPINMLRKLRALDLFSGCGGLTVGFDNDALASCDTRWAVEMDPGAVETFRHNFPDATVYDEDANGVLRAAIEQRMTGTTASRSSKLPSVPKVGEVEMIYAGPPCQGFSDLNAAPKSNDAKNTLIPVTLSYVELFRPKAFLLENVTGMLTYRLGGQQKGRHAVSGGFKGGVPRFIVRVLLSLGYQVTWFVAQAGNVGVPQSRRRLIVLATLPHVKLPEWPEATHLTSLERETMHVRDEHAGLGEKEQSAVWAQKLVFCNEMNALFPPSTVGDIIDDLPPYDWRNPNRVMGLSMRQVEALRADPTIPVVDAEHPDGKRVCVSCGPETPRYASAPRSELQRWLRRTRAGDWLGVGASADAPTEGEMEQEEKESVTQPLLNYVNKSYAAEVVERVCHISREGEERDHRTLPNALEPWALSPSNPKSVKNGLWVGLYGRLEEDGLCRTVTTNPDPMGKAGKILHPVQNRVLTVRELARAQTFPDSFEFRGNVVQMYRQIGNAVPPLLATSINRSLFQALLASPQYTTGENKAREVLGLPPLVEGEPDVEHGKGQGQEACAGRGGGQ